MREIRELTCGGKIKICIARKEIKVNRRSRVRWEEIEDDEQKICDGPKSLRGVRIKEISFFLFFISFQL